MIRLFCACLLGLFLSACALVDAEQDSLCRRAIPALLDVSRGVRVLQSAPVGDGAVTVRFWLGADGRDHRIACVFAGSGLSQKKRLLTGVALDGRAIGDSAVFYLVTRWLETQGSVAAEPAPATGRPMLTDVAPKSAYAIQHILSAMPKLGIYALIAAAYALLYGLVGRINLAFGAFAALGGISAVMVILAVEAVGFASIPYALLAGVIASLVIAGGYGAAAGRWIVAPLAGRPGQQALIASIGLLVALEEFLRIAQGANTLWLPPIFNTPFPVARSTAYDATTTPLAIATTAAGGAAAFFLLAYLKGTRFGRNWRAAADEPVAAELFGISMRAMIARTFALAAAVTGFAGMLVVLFYGGIGFAGGAMLGLTALIAAVLGGIGSVGGAMSGGVIIGLIEAVWSAFWPIEHKDAVMFVLLALMLALKPAGLFSGRAPGPMRV